MTRERIEDMREVVLPFVKKRLLETNYEGLGESDAEMFAKDFDEILDLANKALEQESIFEKINKMKAEIAGSLEFWDYSPNNNPLARDILETLTYFWGDVKAESEG